MTASRRPPADRVTVSILPAARIADGVTHVVDHDDHYSLEISSADGQHVLRTATEFEWDAALDRAAWFRNLTWADAVERWRRTGMT